MSDLPSSKPPQTSGDPMHGVTLKMIVTRLQEHYGWQELGEHIKINCFTSDPSISSSLKFLRRTPWAREKVEALYLATNWSDNPSDLASNTNIQDGNSSSSNSHIWGKKS